MAQETVTGPVKIYDTVYESVDPGPPFTEAPRTKEDWQPPKPTDAERKAGFIAFFRPEPFEIKPWSRPKPEERLTKISSFAAQGQKTNLWFAIFALEPLKGFSVQVGTHEIRSKKTGGLSSAPTVSLQIRYAHFWAQRTDWRGRTYYITPELLLPMRDGKAFFPAKGGTLEERPLDIPEGECRLFWVHVAVPENAKSGEYSFTLILQATNKAPLRLPLTIRVLPFRLLKPPDKRWLLYSDSWFLGNLPDEKLLSVLREIAEVGIDGFTELPFGKIDLTGLKEGKVAYDPEPLLRWLKLMQKVGLRGPHTIGAFVEDQAASALGLQVDLNKDWDEPLKEAVRLIARTVAKTLRPYRFDWLFYGWDEPSPENLRAIQQYRYWSEGGAKTYVTFYQRGTYDVAGKWMTHPCFSVGLVNTKEMAIWAKRECGKNGQKFFWYGSGCYLGQEGRMFPNRYLTGWLFWKTKADGQVSWTFIRSFEDPFNDFDGSKANPVEPKDQCTVYPKLERQNDYGSIVGIIPAIQWEAIREGINDYRYAYTLKNLIAYAKQIAVKRKDEFAHQLLRLADESETVLNLLEESVPWGNEVGARNYTNENLQQVRFVLARQIERLVLALEGKNIALSETKERQVLVRIQLLPPERSGLTAFVPLPVISIPKLETAPRIDGQMAEGEWDGAAVAEPFCDYQMGQPMPKEIATKALAGFDERNLYIVFVCLEPNLKGMKSAKQARDSDGVWMDESVEVFIASDKEPNRYAHIIVNAAGSVYDELVFDVGWNADLQVATSIASDRWICELAIPWSSLPFVQSPIPDPRSQTFRINFCRNRHQVDKGVTHWAWSPTFAWFHTPERFGIGILETGDVVITQVQLPRYFGENQVKVNLHNKSNEVKKVRVNGQQIGLMPKSEKQVRFQVPASVGKHKKRIELQWDNEFRSLEVTYVIPRPLILVSPIVLADERGKAVLPVVVNLLPEQLSKATLVVDINGKVYKLPLNKEWVELRCRLLALDNTVRLRFDFAPKQVVEAKLLAF
ncbi:MAG: DUF4091 domain-containing protein [Candidatus Kryptonium sp.]|nr:DUF4091 domain-containing protein [Candidatus Kryptonium sp.]